MKVCHVRFYEVFYILYSLPTFGCEVIAQGLLKQAKINKAFSKCQLTQLASSEPIVSKRSNLPYCLFILSQPSRTLGAEDEDCGPIRVPTPASTLGI